MSKPQGSAGIDLRHSKRCATRAGGACDCIPSYQAHVFDARTGKRIRKTFPTRSAARLWRQDALVAVRNGKLAESRPKTTVREACEACSRRLGPASCAPAAATRSSRAPSAATSRTCGCGSTQRSGPHRSTGCGGLDLQDIVDRQVSLGVAPATIGTMLGAIGAVYGRAVLRDELEVSPAANVKLPAIRNGRTRFASPAEAVALLAAAPARDRPVWATAMYAGLRRGELMALRWEDIDLVEGTILVARGWDREGPTSTKNRGRRRVPITDALREQLAIQRLRQPPGFDLAFGLASHRPFLPDRMQGRADEAWKAAGLKRLTLHDCRHTFASFAIAAGVNAKALSIYLGHSSVAITFDRYGHLMPGSENEAAGLLNAYLASGR